MVRVPSQRSRVMLAVLVSSAIHVAMLTALAIVDVEYIELDESPPLAARLAPLAPVAATATKAPVRPKRKPRPAPEAAAVPPAPSSTDAVTPGPPPAETTAPADEVQARAEPRVPEPVASEPPAGPPIAFPERMELEFDIARNANEAPLGRVAHRFERDGARYSIRSVTSAAGIAKLFTSGRYVQESRGLLTPQGFQPEQFVVRRGRTERTDSADFDWAGSRAMLSAGGATKESPLPAGAQDQLSYLHQLSFLISDPSLPAVSVTNGRRFYRVKLEILGWETVAIGLGSTSALHVRSQFEGESRIDYWLAPDYANLPVKVRVRDKRGEEFEQVLTSIKVK